MSEQTPNVDDAHRRPAGVSDAEIEATDSVGQAEEFVERARGHLYELHHLIGRADILYKRAADQLEAVGRTELSERLRNEIIGLNVIHGRWTFQLVEEFDDGFWTAARDAGRAVRDEITDGKRHVSESEMKARNRTPGQQGHEATPDSSD